MVEEEVGLRREIAERASVEFLALIEKAEEWSASVLSDLNKKMAPLRSLKEIEEFLRTHTVSTTAPEGLLAVPSADTQENPPTLEDVKGYLNEIKAVLESARRLESKGEVEAWG
jgi:hypothetical protein